jgi:hypothetical protein
MLKGTPLEKNALGHLSVSDIFTGYNVRSIHFSKGTGEVQNVPRSAWVKTDAASVCLNRRRLYRIAGSIWFYPRTRGTFLVFFFAIER